MEMMVKRFVQKHKSYDCEGRNWCYVDTTESYEKLANDLATEWDGWFDAVRIVEKVFNPDTFEVHIKPIKETRRTYDGFLWNHGTEEISYENAD